MREYQVQYWTPHFLLLKRTHILLANEYCRLPRNEIHVGYPVHHHISYGCNRNL
jgi:hypothetical protein